MAAAAAAGGQAGKGRDISLAALRRHDPYISRIVDVASQVALYTFGHRANEWEKTDVEGTLFVYTRSASPKHGFTIMNRLSMENRTEPITKDLDFLLQDPFLLYRNARSSICGIWFYDTEECQRIAELMKNLTQYEQLKAHHGAGAGTPPMTLSSREEKEVDIVRMLARAKDEYTKCKTCSEPKPITSSPAVCHSPSLIKPVPLKPGGRPQRLPRPSQTSDLEPQHLSLSALFGKQDRTPCHEPAGPPRHPPPPPEKIPVRPGAVRSLSHEEARRPSPSLEEQLCPAIQKLLVRGTDLHLLSELPERRPCDHRGAVGVPARPGSPRSPGPSSGVHSAPRTQNLLEKLRGSSRIPAPAVPPPLAHPLPLQMPGPRAPGREQPGGPSAGPGQATPQELLRRLQTVPQEPPLTPSRPALAAKFPVASPSASAPTPLEPWRDRPPGTQTQAPLLQVLSPQRVPAAAAPSLLMSPMVFTQHAWAPPQDRASGLLPLRSQDPAATPTGLLLPLQPLEPPGVTGSPLTKLQLQEALLHLVQNDDSFLNIIYEAYLFSTTQMALKKTL
ncbi:mRNA-decapping enzyme 1B isoform X1 [Camelus dromedarius]|uniref:mRNA-decapping enzyme 1B isoform X1 n=2 Tax=Camelus dromedarius TaxID=9838 RepID=UPI003119FE9C